MSKSPRTPNPHAPKSGKRATVPAAAPDARTRPPDRPWVIGGIDYGPAITAVCDLVAWAFDLAERDVADWPEGQRRVRSAQRFVLARVRGERPCSVPMDDVLFTAGLLARIFEADLRLPISNVVEILAQLGLPTEMVPIIPRAASVTRCPQDPPLAPIRPLRPRPTAGSVRPAPSDVCDGCGQPAPRFPIAA